MNLFLLMLFSFTIAFKKPYTLKVPMNAPIGGPINPMGAMCTEAVTMALDAINSNPEILPNYNLQIDMGDDQCLSTAASRMTLQFYENLEPVVLSSKIFGNLTLPLRTNFSGKAYVPPLYIGGLCSPTCLTAARLPQQYDFVNVVIGCTEPQFTNRKLYPNFYRFAPSFVEVEKFRAKLMHYLGWNRMGYLADAVQTTYDDAIYFAKAILGAGKKVAAEEFYMDNPDESISRLKAADVRVIYGNCYVNFCPALACEAYRQGLWGPHVVWIFNSWIDIVNGQLPSWCKKSMVQEFAEYTLYIGPDFLANSQPKDWKTEIGISFDQFNSYMRAKVPNYETHPAFSWRLICFDDAILGARILHNVELELNLRNETLKDIIPDSTRKVELRERIRRGAMEVEATGMFGKAAFLPNSDESYNPPIIVEQLFQGQRSTVLIARDRSLLDPKDYFQKMAPLRWGTGDKKTPRTEPREAEKKIHVPKSTVVGLIVAMVLSLAMKWGLQIAGWRLRTNSRFSLTACIGSTAIAATILAFPINGADLKGLDNFCLTAAPLFIIGLSLMFASLTIKLWESRFNPEEGSKNYHYALFVLLLIDVCLVEAWYLGEMRPSAVAIPVTIYEELTDTIWTERTYKCSFHSGKVVPKTPMAILALQGLVLAIGLILAIRSQHRKVQVTGPGVVQASRYRGTTRPGRIRTTFRAVSSIFDANYGSEVRNDPASSEEAKLTGMAIYIPASILLICAFALSVFSESSDGLFANLAVFSLSSTLTMTFVLQRRTWVTVLFKLGCTRIDPGTSRERMNVSLVYSEMATAGIAAQINVH